MKITKLITYSLIGFLCFISCSEEESQFTKIIHNNVTDSNFINQETALNILTKITFNNDSDVYNKGDNSIKKIKDFKAVRDENNKELFYITNYETGGFIILSADNRITPVLAYSDTNNFSLDYSNEGLNQWIEAAIKSIQDIRNTSENIPSLKLWSHYEKTDFIDLSPQNSLKSESYERPPVGGDPYCDGPKFLYSNILIDKNINMEWHQNFPYNSKMQYNNCPQSNNMCENLDGKYPAGCVPVAIGQIMRYHKFPNHYQWDDYPQEQRSENSLTSSKVIEDIHNYINSYGTGYEVSYSCDATSVPYLFPYDQIFKSFGYKSVNTEIYDPLTIQSRLNNGPVILFANHSTEDKGHMWICDGLMEEISYNSTCRGVLTTKLRMKWDGSVKQTMDGTLQITLWTLTMA